MISSALRTVWSLCATMMTVRSRNSSSSAMVIASSEKLSSAEVGSSSSMISGSFKNIFAIASLCFCPPLNRTHRSQISVSSPCSSSKTKSQWASLSALMSFCSRLSFCFCVSVISSGAIAESRNPALFPFPAGCLVVVTDTDDSVDMTDTGTLDTALTRFSLIVASNTPGSCVRYPM